MDGLQQRLESGARVAVVGCGLGASTRIMAAAHPASTFAGTDDHRASIDLARTKADEAGLSDRGSFAVAGAEGLAGTYVS